MGRRVATLAVLVLGMGMVDGFRGNIRMATTAVQAGVGSAAVEKWASLRTSEMFRLMASGEIKKRTFVKAAAKRWKAKATNLLQGLPIAKSELMTEAATEKLDKVADVMEGGWKSRGAGSALIRSVEIWTFCISCLLRELKCKKITDKEELADARTKNAVILREGLLKLGPTFIKLGQLLSTRIDVVPKEYISELILLQDNVPGFGGDKAVAIIEEDFGASIDELYESFDRNPIAAASLGQVHIAEFNGTKVAVKVQRQGLDDLFDQDLKNLKLLAKILDKLDPKSDGADRDWVRIYEESAKLLYKEIDYINEGENAQRFSNNFKSIPWIKVPDIFWDRVSKRVLTMEYVPGVKINNIEEIERRGINRELLAKRSAESYLAQLCRYGFFHCDPHPGNVACDEEYDGRLIYYDFGMMDELQDYVKLGLVNLIFGIYENDYKLVCDSLEQMRVLKTGIDRISVEKIARFFLDQFQETINQDDAQWLNEMDKEEAKRRRKERRAQLGEDLLSVGGDVPFKVDIKFPPTFTFVFRAFTSLDGIGKGLSSTYDLTKLAQPFLKELIDLRDGSVTLSLLKQAAKALGWRKQDIAAVVQSPRKVAYLEDVTKKLEQGDLKLRVRVLESERAFKRVDLQQRNIGNALAASIFLNAALFAGGSAGVLMTRACLALAATFAAQVPLGYAQLKKLDKESKRYGLA